MGVNRTMTDPKCICAGTTGNNCPVHPATTLDYMVKWGITAVADAPHTLEDDFQHFLSYSGLSDEPAEVIAKLRMAYEAGQ